MDAERTVFVTTPNKSLLFKHRGGDLIRFSVGNFHSSRPSSASPYTNLFCDVVIITSPSRQGDVAPWAPSSEKEHFVFSDGLASPSSDFE